ncbi:hypothetical protein [Streptomyces atratus]|uniref:hypothetical protein n=1 Tax=Streptomyces atratus TaxID=1893 RepID=UPI002256441C|nr:hypothetical protein [Streptomyces atratus]MCX5345319.1 hypothetical protein [Streptomyces atratus]
MRITRNRPDTSAGPAEHFNGFVWTEPDEWHWHGAAPRTFMTHLAVVEAAVGLLRRA